MSTSASSAAAWLRYAQSDLDLAAAEPWGGVLRETLAYHAQQAAEKALKAVLLHATRETPPRTHDVVLLCDLAREAGHAPPVDAAAAQRLTEYAVLTRYPADLGEIDEPERERAVADARDVVEWAERVVGKGRI